MRRRDSGAGVTGSMLLWGVLAVVLAGCGTVSAARTSGDALTAGPPPATAPAPERSEPAVVGQVGETAPADRPQTAEVAIADPVDPRTNFGPRPDPPSIAVEATPADTLARSGEDAASGSALLQRSRDVADLPEEEYDPWEPFNEKMFEFNRGLDRWVLKPAARVYMVVIPEPWQVLIANGFDNIAFVPRFINSLLQGKWGGAGRELGRFLINSTAGIGGLFDPAKDYWGIPKSREDFGQTLGVWGSGPGPYLILPFMEPLTVRDGIGKAVDGLMDPLSYVLPFFWTRAGMKAGDTLNDRALNFELFQGFEESVIDMYSAVRHGYLQRRQQLIKE